jgi:hypothetical protein
MRMHYGLLGLLQHTLRQLARHRRKRIQKLRQRLTRFDVFKQNPHRHARARKHTGVPPKMCGLIVMKVVSSMC